MSDSSDKNQLLENSTLSDENLDDTSRLPAGYRLHFKHGDYWAEIALGIGKVVGFLPACLVLSLTVFNAAWHGRSTPPEELVPGSFPELIQLLFSLFLSWVIFCVLSIALASALVWVVQRGCLTCKLPYENQLIGASIGGSVGFLLIGPVFLFLPNVKSEIVLALVLATLLGNLGGVLGAKKMILEVRKFEKNEFNGEGSLLFSIKHLLIATLILAGVFTLTKMLGLAQTSFLIALAIWLPIQIVALGFMALTNLRKSAHE